MLWQNCDFNSGKKSTLLQPHICKKKSYLLNAKVLPTDSEILIKLWSTSQSNTEGHCNPWALLLAILFPLRSNNRRYIRNMFLKRWHDQYLYIGKCFFSLLSSRTLLPISFTCLYFPMDFVFTFSVSSLITGSLLNIHTGMSKLPKNFIPTLGRKK